ncbi:SurA N-terminal domain-containing protein [Uruburuella testudinis]|uniref:Periplasmic chaperone PpiD n=1 Tax=Uruburuella testudinis TaxID=1282863 RepID=A0ABY4DWQ9_9NEIS|nr:SurA N-terminal domain-containing protein [Uruburuella testudinis]UOO83129.1 SurA N-terminal domain-containing protein [Uruburuella testudinis]
MFASVEKYSGPAKVLLGLIALTFVGFGVSTVAAPGSDYIVKVGDQKVSQQALNQAVQNAQAAGGNESRDAIFNALLQRALLTEGAKQMGVSVSQQQLKQIIVDDPSFHDASGKFSQDLLNQYLSQRHLSEDQFVAEIREQFALQNMMNLVQNGTLVSDAQARQLVNLMQSQRTIRTVTFSPEAFAAQVKTDDAALKGYYEAHQKDYTIPQAVKLEYVALNAQNLAAAQPVSEQELRTAFEQESAAAQPKREIAHILFPVAQDASDAERNQAKVEAEKVLAQVKADPSKFAALAKQYSKDPGSADNGGNIGYMAKDGGLGKEFEDAAFSLDKGAISDVVQTAYGYHIITILNIQNQPVFEQEKPRLEAELKQKKAAAEFAKAKEQLAEAAFNHPEGLSEVAKITGLKLESPPDWLTRENGQAAGMPEDLLNAVFSDDVLKKKHNSEPVTVNENTVWVVRAKEVREESTESFDKAKDAVRVAYLRSEAAKLAETKAQQALVDLNSGEKPALAWSPVSELTAEQARQSMPPEAYSALLKARPAAGKPAYVLLEGLPAPVLMEVQAVKAPQNAEAQLPQAKLLLAQNQANNVFDSLLANLQKTVKQKQGAQKISDSE